MKNLRSINPYNGESIKDYTQNDNEAIARIIDNLHQGYQTSRKLDVSKRSRILFQLGNLLSEKKQGLAKLITQEMGKPISQSIAEIEKCVWVCNYYAENAPQLLQNKIIETDASQSYVQFDPIGVILAIMPWNYPFWQLFRVLAPNLMLGNTILLKHASNVSGCALAISKLFKELNDEITLLETVLVESSRVEKIIEHEYIKAVTLTGSEAAGSSVAAIAGKNIKKTVLELGGSNAVVVLEDADLDKHIKEMINARFQNTGQSCIAGKRFLVAEAIYPKFIELFTSEVKALELGNPNSTSCEIGPMASETLAEQLEHQLRNSLKEGTKILTGGKRNKAFFEPTVVRIENTDLPVFKEETFGPLAVIKTFSTIEELIALSNSSPFGLGASIFTKNISNALELQKKLEEGAVFINSMVKSDPRLPFGGIKKSGYGRELSEFGLKEFANIKTVYVANR